MLMQLAKSSKSCGRLSPCTAPRQTRAGSNSRHLTTPKAMAQQHICEPKWWTHDTIAVVTGANKGLGFECARQLACEAGFLTVIAARNEKAGQEAVKSLEQSSGGNARLDFHPLEVTDKNSIEAFKNWLQQNDYLLAQGAPRNHLIWCS
ncbi:hypothetical protein DUNSADRAFT_5170 [Dunaliella salina]|uniref:Uncharacterized protein n=1 Tax=Dunaliella salina TaxID=3046 RepID=A0ABQ7H7G5_DUNSA|nr:hypothetical protein DUNSADRAFT_5170 [Dunaliella salina]|eukprot:KAF5842799.1 hypothetical protein DUNSADRAFT_5170 [Dunaliella salina]